MTRLLITPLDIEDYTSGGCYALALVIHDRTGWPLVTECRKRREAPDALVSVDPEDLPGACIGRDACHVFVMAPDGGRLDLGSGYDLAFVSARTTRARVAAAADHQAALGRAPDPDRTRQVAEYLIERTRSP
jgi:hypothetical protein